MNNQGNLAKEYSHRFILRFFLIIIIILTLLFWDNLFTKKSLEIYSLAFALFFVALNYKYFIKLYQKIYILLNKSKYGFESYDYRLDNFYENIQGILEKLIKADHNDINQSLKEFENHLHPNFKNEIKLNKFCKYNFFHQIRKLTDCINYTVHNIIDQNNNTLDLFYLKASSTFDKNDSKKKGFYIGFIIINNNIQIYETFGLNEKYVEYALLKTHRKIQKNLELINKDSENNLIKQAFYGIGNILISNNYLSQILIILIIGLLGLKTHSLGLIKSLTLPTIKPLSQQYSDLITGNKTNQMIFEKGKLQDYRLKIDQLTGISNITNNVEYLEFLQIKDYYTKAGSYNKISQFDGKPDNYDRIDESDFIIYSVSFQQIQYVSNRLHYLGSGLQIDGLSKDQIMSVTKPFDIIGRYGHVGLILENNMVLELRKSGFDQSTNDTKIVKIRLSDYLDSIMKYRKPSNYLQTKSYCYKISCSTINEEFIIRRGFFDY